MHKKDIGLGAVSIALGVWIWYLASLMKPGPGFWPKIVGGSIVILGVIILVMAIIQVRKKGTKSTEVKKSDKPSYLAVLEIVALLLAYYKIFQYVGYTIPTILLICATAYILGYRNWKVMIITAVSVSVMLYLIFTYLLGVNFPGFF